MLPLDVQFAGEEAEQQAESSTPMLDAVESGDIQGPFNLHTVARGENLTVIARRHGVSVNDIVSYNELKDANALSIGQQLKIPPKRTRVADETPGDDVYFVRRGDTLAKIASRFGITVAELAGANGITDHNFIQRGQALKIPGMASGQEGGEAQSGGQGAGAATDTVSAENEVYVVKPGDALARIARKYGVPLADLAAANNISNPNRISVGQKIRIPGTVASSSGGGQDTGLSSDVAETTGLDQGPVDGSQLENPVGLQPIVNAVLRVAPRHDYAKNAIPGILRQAAASGVRNANQVAYILATADHETDFGKPTFRRSETLVEDSNGFRQNGNGSWSARNHVSGRRNTGTSRDDLERRYWDDAYGGRLGNRRGTSDAANYRGRGFVQLTGRTNYEKMTKKLNSEGFTYTLDGVEWGKDQPIDLLANPTHVNRHKELAARCLVDGMMEGTFTGAALGQYVNNNRTDFYNARAVVNGDKRTNGRSIERTARTYAGALSGWANVFRGQS